MKKILSVVFSALFTFALLIGFNASAAIDSTPISVSVPSTAVTTGPVYTIRGELRAIRVSVASGITGTVAVAASCGQVLNVAGHTGTVVYFPRTVAQGIGGVAVATNSFVSFPLSSTVTATVTQVNTSTNTWTIEPIFER